jgi:hypothetical protein
MPLYLIFQNGELKDAVEYETAFRAHIDAEQRFGHEYALAIVVGAQHVDKVIQHIAPPRAKKGTARKDRV